MAWVTRWNALLEEKSSDLATSARTISKTFSFSEFAVSGIFTHPVEPTRKRVQEIWRRQVAALSCDAVDVSSRSELGIGSAKEANEVDTESDGGKGKSNDSEDSDDDDDEFAAMMEMEMTSTGEANRLVATQLGDSSMRTIGGGLDTQELSKEARELAALQRQREEERAMQDGLEQKVKANRPDKTKKYQKVIRRKVIKVSTMIYYFLTFSFTSLRASSLLVLSIRLI
jgi:hypothetical protein